MAFTPGFKKFVGLVCSIAVVGTGIYAYKQGMFAHGDNAQAGTPQSAASLQSGTQPIRTVTQPNGYVASDNTLKAIRDNGLVRVPVQNPSEPFFSETNGIPQGFNVEFAQLLFSDPSFSSPDKPIAVDARHETDT